MLRFLAHRLLSSSSLGVLSCWIALYGCTTVGVSRLSTPALTKTQSGACSFDVYFEEVEVRRRFKPVCDISSHISGLTFPDMPRAEAFDIAIKHICACKADGVILGDYSSGILQHTLKVVAVNYLEPERQQTGRSPKEARAILACRDRGGQWIAHRCDVSKADPYRNTPAARRMQSSESLGPNH